MKKTLIEEDSQATMKMSFFLALFLLFVVFALCLWNKALIVLAWILVVPLIHVYKRKRFLKNAEFCFGKIIAVTLNDNDDVYLSTQIEFMDSSSNKTHQRFVYEHWGDFREEAQDEINQFYEDGKRRIGQEVPVFYKKGNPKKNIVFFNYLED